MITFRKNIVGLMVLCCISAFMSCSNDDENILTNSNAGIGNGGFGVEVKPKKIVRIEEENELYNVAYNFEYDEQGRLVRILQGNASEVYGTTHITYTENNVSIIESIRGNVQDEYNLHIKNGKTVENITIDPEYYNYSKDEYLSEIRCPTERYTQKFILKDGALTQIYIPQDEETEVYEPDFTVPNNTNLDLFGFESLFGQKKPAIFLCAAGKRFKYLPSKMINNTGILEFNYTLNSEGYITCIESIPNWSYKSTYTIFYEK